MTNKTQKIIAGNYYNKHVSKNKFVVYLLNNYKNKLQKLIANIPSESIFEIGSGEGYTMEYLLQTIQPKVVVGSDLDFGIVQEARSLTNQRDWIISDVENIPLLDRTFGLVIALEVLEHVTDPKRALAEMARISSEYILISVPWEPIWRLLNILRMKYLYDLGNTPGHLHNWTLSGIRKLVSQEFKVVKVNISFPWIFIFARKYDG